MARASRAVGGRTGGKRREKYCSGAAEDRGFLALALIDNAEIVTRQSLSRAVLIPRRHVNSTSRVPTRITGEGSSRSEKTPPLP
jgi:hypothetical protein